MAILDNSTKMSSLKKSKFFLILILQLFIDISLIVYLDMTEIQKKYITYKELVIILEKKNKFETRKNII